MEDAMPDDLDTDCAATPSGIMQCLRMLAEEAATLNLSRTLLAIHEALQTCESEGGDAIVADGFVLPVTLH
jgi:hypothetical protein